MRVTRRPRDLLPLLLVALGISQEIPYTGSNLIIFRTRIVTSHTFLCSDWLCLLSISMIPVESVREGEAVLANHKL